MRCPICEGKGGWKDVIDPEVGGRYYECHMCSGKGHISMWVWLSLEFWERMPVRFIEWLLDWCYSKEE